MPEKLLPAIGTKRTARLVNRKIEGQPINADVQKRTDYGAENKREYAKEHLVTAVIHNRELYGVSVKRQCLRRIVAPDTDAAPLPDELRLLPFH
jgi:hypothetical protein